MLPPSSLVSALPSVRSPILEAGDTVTPGEGHHIVLIPENVSGELDFVIVFLMTHTHLILKPLRMLLSSKKKKKWQEKEAAPLSVISAVAGLYCVRLSPLSARVNLGRNEFDFKHNRALHLFTASPPTDYLMSLFRRSRLFPEV